MFSFLHKKNRPKNVWVIQGLFLWVSYGFAGLLYLRFFQQQISFWVFFFAEGFFTVLLLIFLLLNRSFSSRRNILIGFALTALAFALLFLPFSRALFYMYVIVRGFGSIIFYVAYNIEYFALTPENKRLEHMTWYWIIPTVVLAVAPLAGAFLLSRFSFFWFVMAAFVVLAIGVWFVLSAVSPHVTRYTPHEALTHLRGLRLLTAIDGALNKVMKAGIPVFALLYIQTEWEYGKFLSLVAVVSVFVSLAIARHSDKIQKRAVFLWPLAILTGCITAFFYFVDSFLSFFLLTIFLQALTVMTEPIRANIMQDVKKNEPLNWISREIYLNIGRAIFFFIIVLFLRFDMAKEVFLFFAFLNIIFPFMVWSKKVYAAH